MEKLDHKLDYRIRKYPSRFRFQMHWFSFFTSLKQISIKFPFACLLFIIMISFNEKCQFLFDNYRRNKTATLLFYPLTEEDDIFMVKYQPLINHIHCVVVQLYINKISLNLSFSIFAYDFFISFFLMQGVPYEKNQRKMVLALKWWILDRMIVKPKCPGFG